MIKDRNSKDLTEAEEIKKWQEYTEELLKKKKILNNPNNHADILEYKVKWALGSITTKLVKVMNSS